MKATTGRCLPESRNQHGDCFVFCRRHGLVIRYAIDQAYPCSSADCSSNTANNVAISCLDANSANQLLLLLGLGLSLCSLAQHGRLFSTTVRFGRATGVVVVVSRRLLVFLPAIVLGRRACTIFRRAPNDGYCSSGNSRRICPVAV